jgi:RING-box protein 1
MEVQAASNSSPFELRYWKIPTIAVYNFQSNTCGLCRTSIISSCVECQTNNSNKFGCKVTSGTCNHGFHTHCLHKWHLSNGSSKCPICAANWVENK